MSLCFSLLQLSLSLCFSLLQLSSSLQQLSAQRGTFHIGFGDLCLQFGYVGLIDLELLLQLFHLQAVVLTLGCDTRQCVLSSRQVGLQGCAIRTGLLQLAVELLDPSLQIHRLASAILQYSLRIVQIGPQGVDVVVGSAKVIICSVQLASHT